MSELYLAKVSYENRDYPLKSQESISDFENYSKIGGTELKILKYNQTN